MYLHYVLDASFEREVKPRLRGAAHQIRFADDAVLCFQCREDAEKVMEVLPERFAKYGSALPPEGPGWWALGGPGGTGAAAREETSHVRFPSLHAHMRTQPQREVRGPRADDVEASPTGLMAIANGARRAEAGLWMNNRRP